MVVVVVIAFVSIRQFNLLLSIFGEGAGVAFSSPSIITVWFYVFDNADSFICCYCFAYCIFVIIDADLIV